MEIERILSKVREKTENIILFSSVTGKDSILLTHYCAKIFKNVVCVYMYMVKGLEYVQRYQLFLQNRYPNIQYVQVPHYYLSRHLRSGYLGMKVSKDVKKYTLGDLDRIAREKTGINWSVYGSKKVDGINRRLQLNTYMPDYICEASNKVYPLAELNNKQVVKLIQLNGLPMPVMYNGGHLSSGEDVGDVTYLSWLMEYWPKDFEKVIEAFPGCGNLVYEFLNKE
jgi:3'-phosphoadenosine 5'-phosphosulfate sulfotransferase (PAPS reductase)/FAD synthetase